MSEALLLFDIDGTLLTTGRAGMAAMHRVAEDLFGRVWDWEAVPVAGRLDPLIFQDAATHNALDNPHEHHDRFHDRYLTFLEEELAERADRVRPMPGVAKTLELLRDRRERREDIVLGLLTGNYSKAAPMKITAAGLDPGWFTLTAFGDEAGSRPGLVELAMGKHCDMTGQAVDPRSVIVIGDTPLDVQCAQAHGCVAFAVATGRYPVDALHEAGADHVVENLSDPGALLSVVDDAIGVAARG